MHPIGDTIHRDGEEPRIGENNFINTACSGVLLADRLGVLLEEGVKIGELAGVRGGQRCEVPFARKDGLTQPLDALFNDVDTRREGLTIGGAISGVVGKKHGQS
jgi:hypothetical protein